MYPQNNNVCNIEQMIQVAPYALVYLIRASIILIQQLIGKAPAITAKTALTLAVYLTGIILIEKRPNQANIARTIGGVSHDALNRIAKTLAPAVVAFTQTTLTLITGCTPPGYLILDDVLVPKPFSRFIAGSYLDYDTTRKCHVKAHRSSCWYGRMGCCVFRWRSRSGIRRTSCASIGRRTR